MQHAHWLQVTARCTAHVTRRTQALPVVSQIIVSRHERQHRTIPVAHRDVVAKRAVASLGPPLSFRGACQKTPHIHARPSHHTHGLLRRHVAPSLLLHCTPEVAIAAAAETRPLTRSIPASASSSTPRCHPRSSNCHHSQPVRALRAQEAMTLVSMICSWPHADCTIK